MRVFIAIGLPQDVKDGLAALQEALTVGRLVDPDNMHVTLAFLDDQPADVVEAVHEALADIDLPSFDLAIRGVDVISGRAPRLICAGIEPCAALTALRKKVRQAVRMAGVGLKHERFRPHVTLARFPKSAPPDNGRLGAFLEAHGDFALPPFRAQAFGLYRSHLRPDGAVYDCLAEYALREG